MSKSVQVERKLPPEILDSCKVIHGAWNELTKAWTLPVIHALGLKEPAGFNELKHRIEGISATSLTERLRELEKLEVVERKVQAEPLRVKYSLTPKGVELKAILRYFADWAVKWAQQSPKRIEANVVSS